MRAVATLAVAWVAMLFSAVGAAALTVTAAPSSGPPTTSVALAATGFDASTVIDIYFDATDVALAVSTSAGAVNTTIPVPTNAQPGTHWLTLVERRTSAAAQAAFQVFVNWPQTGFGPSKRSFNPYENTINTGNVAQLTPLWSAPLDGFANSKPPVAYFNNLYLRDADQVVRAFSPTGKLLWTAATPFSMFPDALTPAAGNGLVYFSDLNGNVIAYKYNCRSDGGVCAPSWTTNIGSGVAGGLTLYNNKLYAPAQDGLVHVLNPVTGAPGTSLSVAPGTALSSWIAFGSEGSGYVAHGAAMSTTPNNLGGSTNDTYSGTLSPPAVGAATAYVTETDNLLREVQFSWTAALGGSGCFLNIAPAFANNVVYAAGCASLGAYDPGTGSAIWTISTPGASAGLTYANGVLYACINNRVNAYYASYGGKLWTGGYCSAAPIVVGGVLYVTWADVKAYTLTAVQSSALPAAKAAPKPGDARDEPPDPKTLTPNR